MSTDAEQTPAAPPSPDSPPAAKPRESAEPVRPVRPRADAEPPRPAGPAGASHTAVREAGSAAADASVRPKRPEPAAEPPPPAAESTGTAPSSPSPATPSPEAKPPPRPYAPPVPAGPPKPVGAPLHMASVLPSDIPRPEPEPPAERRTVARTVAAAVALVTGVGLVVGAATGSLLSDGPSAQARPGAYEVARGLWHATPVDTLFPPRLEGDGAGPGGADRVWVRVAVAPPADCKSGLDAALARELRRVGCEKLLRATYTDATRSSVTTVGMVFTAAGSSKMGRFEDRFEERELAARTDMLPRAYGTETGPAAGFGAGQRATWTVRVLSDAPVVLYAVTGFADGRAVTEPQPANEAVHPDATTAPAQAGLGHDAEGIADRVERGLRKTSAKATESPR
ncbi:hypothetical protein [Streptomyces sp. NPDC004134]|uniref:hypothetical protein n=1 Tax=Streptomyces sp. NPDC004134 TaxID=3364691 RepID=UPI0036B96A78